ncbi:MAG: cell envelope biogenesis protein OmpA, partial [Flavobacteriales bacterium CG_4_9_14_3_um_filter_32_8]
PLDLSNTVEGRKKNRRIEVILTPKLDELLKLLGE